MRTASPITSRPLDLVYFAFFLVHIPATLLIDLQALYPPSLTPYFIRALPQLYVQMSNDPLIGNVLGMLGDSQPFVWFKTFLAVEAYDLFQLPVFVLGARGLWRDSRSIYVLLLIYAASTTTTTLPCLSVLMTTPTTSAQTITDKVVSVTTSQRFLLLSSYIPFFIIPFIMTIDMASRLSKLVMTAMDAADDKKLS
ncbi:transmembrane protein 6/97 [Suillus subalutaceus]|uniref:transmembrane protein 6/97 n=1 Tax=Suillus subalutaceus TaxID=48586 RepID=UPI001B87A244|nr:transmembrane protein 6/97 [Suillus subalutaceus]KAG1842152.1 transmembrane protein 6/97 [Suillus subalutaceus]